MVTVLGKSVSTALVAVVFHNEMPNITHHFTSRKKEY